MSKRYFIHLSYNGKNYNGWQIQPNAPSVQETIEVALSTILRQDLKIMGAGRTDSGVHAKNMYAHFDCNAIANKDDLIFRLNNFLPKDISIYSIREVKNDAHARFDAKSRLYKYYITTQKDPFNNDFKYKIQKKIDIDLINEASKILFEYNDFTSFSKLHTDVKTNICEIKVAQWTKDGSNYTFTIEANRFLRNMVRAIVGTLIEIGYGKQTIDDFRKIIENKNRGLAGSSAPAHALFLEGVTYDSDIYID